LPLVELLHIDRTSPFSAGDYLVDYSAVNELRAHTIARRPPEDLNGKDADLRCKIVLLGNASFEELPSDKFTPPAYSEPMPGAFVHAASVYKLLRGPLYGLTGLGRVLLDVLFSLTVIIAVAVFGHFFRSVGLRRFQKWVLAGMALFSLGTGIIVHLVTAAGKPPQTLSDLCQRDGTLPTSSRFGLVGLLSKSDLFDTLQPSETGVPAATEWASPDCSVTDLGGSE
jgi:hypothetical protein